MAEWLSQQFGQQFVVENRLGMAGNLANQAVAKAPPDGHTLLFTGPNSTISASLYKKLPYNLIRDTTPVGSMMRLPNVMVVPSSLPIKTVQEFMNGRASLNRSSPALMIPVPSRGHWQVLMGRTEGRRPFGKTGTRRVSIPCL